MLKLRILLVVFCIVLAAIPYCTAIDTRERNRAFDEEMKRHIQLTGSSEGFYGDCSGFSVIIPFLAIVFSSAYALWCLIALILSRTFSQNSISIHTLLIGITGVLPGALWLCLILSR